MRITDLMNAEKIFPHIIYMYVCVYVWMYVF